MPKTPKKKLVKPVVLEPAAESPPEPVEFADELAEALRGMVVAAEAAGGRDRPEVVHGREVLAKLGKRV